MSKLCLECKKEVPNKSKQYSNQKYCSDRCKKAAYRKRKSIQSVMERKRLNLIQNDEFLYLIKLCKQAKTVQIVPTNLKAFTKTMILIKNKEKGDVKRCHIAPVKGPGFTGQIHYKNIFYGGTHQNELFGNNYLSGGKYIENKNLLERWRVNDEMSNKEILAKIEEFLGDIVEKYIKTNSICKSKKARIVEKIMEANPSADKGFLIHQSMKYLRHELHQLRQSCSFVKSYGLESKYMAYMNELTRFMSYGGKRKELLKSLRRVMVVGYMALERVSGSETHNKYFYCTYEPLIIKKYSQAMLKEPRDWSELKDIIYDTVFKVLQGGDLNVKEFRKKVMSYLWFPEKAWRENGLEYYRDPLKSFH